MTTASSGVSPRQPWRGPLARFVLAALILSALAYRWEAWGVEALLPVFQQEIEALDDTFRIDRLYLDREGADRVVRVEVGLAHSVVSDGRTYYPDPRGHANASTLMANVTLPAVLVGALALAWPVRTWRYGVGRALLLALVLPLLWAVDVPFVLLGSLWDLLTHAASGSASPLWMWVDFLQSGGRLALAIVAGLGLAAFGAPLGTEPTGRT